MDSQNTEQPKPKIVITNVGRLKSSMKSFIEDFLFLIPYSSYYKRAKGHSFNHIYEMAKKNGVTDLFVVNCRGKKLRNLLHIKLPNGSVSLYRLLNFQSIESFKEAASSEFTNSEVFFKGFKTDLGKEVKSSLSSLFVNENLAARQSVIIKNCEDYIFFRKYKYVFLSNTDVRLQECGPRFTLKLRSFRKKAEDLSEEKIEYLFSEFEFSRQERKDYFKKTHL